MNNFEFSDIFRHFFLCPGIKKETIHSDLYCLFFYFISLFNVFFISKDIKTIFFAVSAFSV